MVEKQNTILFENKLKASLLYFQEMLKNQFYFSSRYLFSYTLLFAIFLFALVMIIFVGRTSVIVWVGLFFPVVIYARDYCRYKKNARVAFAKSEELNKENGNEVTTYVDSKNIYLGKPGEKDTKTFSLDSLKKMKITKNFIVIYTEAGNQVILQKDGFVKGNTDDFIEFMYGHKSK